MISWPQQGSASTPGGGSPGSSGSVLLCLFSLAPPYHPGSITLRHGVACPWASPSEECEKRVGSEAPRQAPLARAGESPRPAGIPGSPHSRPSRERERNWTVGTPGRVPCSEEVSLWEAWVVGRLSLAVVGRAAAWNPWHVFLPWSCLGPGLLPPGPWLCLSVPGGLGQGVWPRVLTGGALAGLSALGFSMRLSEQKSPRPFSPKPPEIPKV